MEAGQERAVGSLPRDSSTLGKSGDLAPDQGILQRASTGDEVKQVSSLESNSISPITKLGSNSVQCRTCGASYDLNRTVITQQRLRHKLEMSLLACLVTGMYMTLGLLTLEQCPAQRLLPLWVMGTGIGLFVGIPVIYWRYYDCWDDILEASTDDKFFREIQKRSRISCSGTFFGTALLLPWLVWWSYGTFITISMYPKVSYSQGSPDYCEAALYVITLEVISISWLIALLGLTWIAGQMVADPRFRKIVQEVIHLQ